MTMSPGSRLRRALTQEAPLQMVGAVTAHHALLAARAGFRALYLPSDGVSASSLGAPNIGVVQLDDLLTDVWRITDVCELPLMVDGQSGCTGSALHVGRAVRGLARCGAAALLIEDAAAIRADDRPVRELVGIEVMVDRIRAAVDARTDEGFVVAARTQAAVAEGVESALERANAYVEAGAELLVPDAVSDLASYRRFTRELSVPIVADSSEFSGAPLFSVEELKGSGVGVVLYPLSVFRATSRLAEDVLTVIRNEGTQRSVIDRMRTGRELYERANPRAYERRLGVLMTDPEPEA
jgi:methylisocitrate lyase